MAATALERICVGPASVRSALGASTRHLEQRPHTDTTSGAPIRWLKGTGVGGPSGLELQTELCTRCGWTGGETRAVATRGQLDGGRQRRGVVAQATRKQGGKVAQVGKKLQLKPPAQRPQQSETGEAKKKEGGRTEAKQEGPSATAIVEQPKAAKTVDEQTTAQQAEVGGRSEGTASSSGTAEGATSEQGEAAKAEATEALTPEEQAAQLQALRKSLQGQPGGEPVRSSGAFYSGVLEEIGLINWPPLRQVAGTTALVMGMLVGAATVLTVLNYGLSEGTKAFFEDGPLRDAVKSTFGL